MPRFEANPTRPTEIREQITAGIRDEGDDAAAFHLDLADPASMAAFAKEAEDAFGPMEVLVSNAARIQLGGALETAPDEFEEVLRVNVGGPSDWYALRRRHGGPPAGRPGLRHLGRGGPLPDPYGAAVVRIIVDRDLRQRRAASEGEAPTVFSGSKKGELTVLQPEPPEELRAEVLLAVKYRPTHALWMEED